MNDNAQARKWLITENNPIEHGQTHPHICETLNKLTLDYYCLADEVASTGTMHTHIYLYSATPIRFSTLKNKFPRAHIEKAYGSSLDNRNYILKAGKWTETDKHDTIIEGSFFESGTLPSEGREHAPFMAQVLESIQENKTTSEIVKMFPKLAFKVKDIDILRETLLSDKYATENRSVSVSYIFGNTGTGKTFGIYAKHNPLDVCRITSYLRDRVLFDAYHGQDVLVFEEFSSQIPIQDMLNYLDCYPIHLPARYSDRIACYTHVYITSNLPLHQQYREVQSNTPAIWQAFLRRINTVIEYTDFNTFTEFTGGQYYEKHQSKNPFI